MQSKVLGLLMGLSLVACSKDPPPSQYPAQQPYPQQQGYPPPQQQPQGYPPPQQQPQAMPQQPAPAGSAGTPTAIPGVTKNANGTCSITPPSLTGGPATPLVGPCPPGI